MNNDDLNYLSGFQNHFETESLAGALPPKQNSPQKTPYGLYAEQLSGAAFTAPRHENLRTWFYRIRPSVVQGVFKKLSDGNWTTSAVSPPPASPEQFRWDPSPEPKSKVDFIDSLTPLVEAGSNAMRKGGVISTYYCNQPMGDRFFYHADAELMIVPEKGELTVRTECGILKVVPCEIVVIPCGMKFQIDPTSGLARGYVCENFGLPFRLPGLGPIGANGLANPRHFLSPVAHYEDKSGKFRLTTKFSGSLWECDLTHSPLDVVAWAGNLSPYKYDLNLFNTINTVSFDHPDPSIFTVLTSPGEIAGTANFDFVIFPPRWMVGEKTFRPPYYHRNCMNEFMGLIKGVYDAKATGFTPGGASVHNRMSPHGPDAETFETATKAELKPHYQADTLAFMWESSSVFSATDLALKTPRLQKNYMECWQGLKSHFDPKNIEGKF